jgi:NADH dehydrogenase FAD-containing subunit
VRNRTSIGLAVAAAMALVLVTPASVPAQTPAQTPQTQAQQPPESRDQARGQQLRSPVQGALVSVDAEAKKITVKPEQGEELVIAYTETTEISGAQKDAAGLATMADARVTVHFTENADTKAKTATRIIVQPKQ